MEGTFWQKKKKKNLINGNCAAFAIDSNNKVKLHYNTKINAEYNK